MLIREHNKVFGASKEALRIARGKLLDPDFVERENEAFKKALKNIQFIEL